MEENNKFINKNEVKDNNMNKPEIKKIEFSILKTIEPEEKENKVKFICKKRQYIKVENKNKTKKKFFKKEFKNEGRWSKEENNKFLEGIARYGINWEKFKILIKTRSTLQIRTHAQKFYIKMKSCKDDFLGIDFTLNSIHNIKDMVFQIKSINNNYDIINVFKYLNSKIDIIKKLKKKFNKNNNNDSINYSNNTILKDIEKNYINIPENLNMNQNNQLNIFENSSKKIYLNQQNNNIINNFNNILINNFNNNFSLNNNFLQMNNINTIINNQNFNLVSNSFNNSSININNNQIFFNNNIISNNINSPYINGSSNLDDLLILQGIQNLLNYNINYILNLYYINNLNHFYIK